MHCTTPWGGHGDALQAFTRRGGGRTCASAPTLEDASLYARQKKNSTDLTPITTLTITHVSVSIAGSPSPSAIPLARLFAPSITSCSDAMPISVAKTMMDSGSSLRGRPQDMRGKRRGGCQGHGASASDATARRGATPWAGGGGGRQKGVASLRAQQRQPQAGRPAPAAARARPRHRCVPFYAPRLSLGVLAHVQVQAASTHGTHQHTTRARCSRSHTQAQRRRKTRSECA